MSTLPFDRNAALKDDIQDQHTGSTASARMSQHAH
jgi:hypothetical protein